MSMSLATKIQPANYSDLATQFQQHMYGNPLVPTILAQHAMCKVRGLVRTNITQPKSIALLIDDAEQCKEFCGRHQDCKLDHIGQQSISYRPVSRDMWSRTYTNIYSEAEQRQ